MSSFMLTRELALRLERAERNYVISRMSAIAERPGNPEGVDIRRFGEAAALYASGMPWPQFNVVKGIGHAEIDRLPELANFFAERGMPCRIELTPAGSTPELLGRLTDLKWVPQSWHTVLYGQPLTQPPVYASGVSIRPIAADEFNLYGELHCRGTGMDVSGAAIVGTNNRVLHGRPGWHMYVGCVDGKPAGVSIMCADGDIASFTFAATLPEYRRRGLHTAFLHHRMHEAHRLGCRWVTAQAAFSSTSQTNMERAGLRIAFTRTNWIRAREQEEKQ